MFVLCVWKLMIATTKYQLQEYQWSIFTVSTDDKSVAKVAPTGPLFRCHNVWRTSNSTRKFMCLCVLCKDCGWVAKSFKDMDDGSFIQFLLQVRFYGDGGGFGDGGGWVGGGDTREAGTATDKTFIHCLIFRSNAWKNLLLVWEFIIDTLEVCIYTPQSAPVNICCLSRQRTTLSWIATTIYISIPTSHVELLLTTNYILIRVYDSVVILQFAV